MKHVKLYENWSEDDNEAFLNKMLEEVNSISTIEELDQYWMKSTMGGFMPLNPIEPLRTTLREKVYELKSKNEETNFNRYLYNLEGERKEINLPPGAMY